MSAAPLRWLVRAATLLMACLVSCPWTARCADEWEYTIASGENLWIVTDRYLKSGSYLGPLQKLNGIRDPRRIPPGTRIRIPVEWLRRDPATAQLVAIDGQVQVRAGLDGIARDARPAQTLAAGDALETGTSGGAPIVADALSALPAVRIPALSVARYVVRVRAVDSHGLEGMYAEKPLDVKPRPAAPIQIEPPEGTEAPAEGGTLRWQPAGASMAYRL